VSSTYQSIPTPPERLPCFEQCRVDSDICKYSHHPRMRKNHHFLESMLKTSTSMRKSMMPSHSIQQKEARKKYCMMAVTAWQAA